MGENILETQFEGQICKFRLISFRYHCRLFRFMIYHNCNSVLVSLSPSSKRHFWRALGFAIYTFLYVVWLTVVTGPRSFSSPKKLSCFEILFLGICPGSSPGLLYPVSLDGLECLLFALSFIALSIKILPTKNQQIVMEEIKSVGSEGSSWFRAVRGWI